MKLIKNDLKWFRQKCTEVFDTDEIEKIKNDCIQILDENPNGVGLAANQIGYLKQVAVIRTEDEDLVLVNPKIIKRSKYFIKSKEGCLSFPTINKIVKRNSSIFVEDLNNGVTEFEGFLACIAQHEIDHLNGKTMLDKTKNKKRKKKRKK